MAFKKPSFITGANAKIKAGNITMAYAQDVSYAVTVTTIPIETMGRYEVISNEPVAYFVEGSLSVIRYTKYAKENEMPDTAPEGNSVGNWKMDGGGKASEHFNPGDLLASQTWDLDIFQKREGGAIGESVVKLHDCRFIRKGGAINKRGVLTESFGFNAIYKDDDGFKRRKSGGVEDLS